MTTVDKRTHIKPKRGQLDQPEFEGHVKPGRGRLAKQNRRRIERDLRRGRANFNQTNAEAELNPSVIGMTPRPLRGKRGAVPLQPAEAPRLRPSDRPQERVRPIGLVWLSWRWVSGGLSVVLIIILALLLSMDAFYVSSAAVGGVNYLQRDEVFGFSGAYGEHIFWLDAKQIKRRIESNNNVSSAEVRLGWPPNALQIVIREREPVLVWEQAEQRVWVDINGIVMYQRHDRADLLRVVYDPQVPQPEAIIGSHSRIPTEIVHGALLLHSGLPRIDVLLYNPDKGLGWRDPRGWMAWFGVGDNMVMKAHVYESVVNYNLERVQFGEVNVSDPDNPVYTVLWRKTE